MRRALPLLLVAFGCSDPGPRPVQVPLTLSGDASSSEIETATGPLLRLGQAQLAFGPLYFCPSPSGAESCDVARLEWLGSAVVDLLDDSARRAGTLHGSSGAVASYLCDLGISSQLTSDEAFVLEAAAELGENSLLLRGTVEFDARSLPWSASLPLAQTETTVSGTPLIQSPQSQRFSEEVTTDLSEVNVRFSAARWLESVDFSPYFAEEPCSPDAVVCRGDLMVVCPEDEGPEEITDCLAQDQVCVPGLGCQDELRLEGAALRTLKSNILSNFGPLISFERRSN